MSTTNSNPAIFSGHLSHYIHPRSHAPLKRGRSVFRTALYPNPAPFHRVPGSTPVGCRAHGHTVPPHTTTDCSTLEHLQSARMAETSTPPKHNRNGNWHIHAIHPSGKQPGQTGPAARSAHPAGVWMPGAGRRSCAVLPGAGRVSMLFYARPDM